MDPAVSELVIIVVLVLLNAVFVAAEIAVVTVRRTRLQQLADEGNRAARRVQRLSTNPGRFLATIQVGITFIGFLAAAFAGAGIATRLADSIDDIEAVRVQAPVIALLAVTAVLSLFTIVVGELVPKQARAGPP
jgi:putative hemolysin